MGWQMLKLLIGGSPCTHWFPVCGYEGFYEISKQGEVRRVATGKILKTKKECNGYIRVNLSKRGVAKSELLHRLVAKTFIENPENMPTINHIDENKSNNSAGNLEWVDMSYQNSYGQGAVNRNRAKCIPICQFDMEGNYIRTWDSAKEACDALGLNPSSVGHVCRGERRYKSTGGHKFKYAKEVVAI